MIKSMTGFGRAELKTKSGLFAVEIKTLNHKFLEITSKLVNSLAIFDDKIKEVVKTKVKRGKVYINLTHDTLKDAGSDILIDEKLAINYAERLKKLKKKLNIEGVVELSDIMSFPGVVNCKLAEKDTEKLWPEVRGVVSKALDALTKDREKEGSFLFNDFSNRIARIKNIVSGIESSANSNVRDYKKKLEERIKELSGGYPIDHGRLEMEVAIFAKNSDITEELTRLNNHIENFGRTIKKNGEVGKKLDFIAQELHREINTIGSKASGYNISKGVIEIKTEIEKIREQLKNIE